MSPQLLPCMLCLLLAMVPVFGLGAQSDVASSGLGGLCGSGGTCLDDSADPAALVQTRLRAASAAAVDPVLCPANGTVMAGQIDGDLEVTSGECKLSNIAVRGSIIVSGGASLVVGGKGSRVDGSITVQNSPGSTIRLSGVEVKEVSLRDAGSLYAGGGSKLGPIEVAKSGHIALVNSSAFELKMSDSGNLTIADGASVGEVEASGSGHMSISRKARVAGITASMCKGLLIGGGASVAREVEASFIDQGVELNGATLGGSLTVRTSPDASIHIGAAKVAEVLVFQAGKLGLGAGAELGSITVKNAGDVTMSGGVGRDMTLEQSGNLTVTAGARLRNIVVKGSGLVSISQDAEVSSFKSSRSQGLVISGNVTVRNDVEVLEGKGGILLSGSTLGGPVTLGSGGNVSLVRASVVAEGLFVERGGGSLRMEASSFPRLSVKGLQGDVVFVNMNADNLDLEGVQGRVVLEGMTSHGDNMFSNIAGGIACITPAQSQVPLAAQDASPGITPVTP